MWRFYDKIPNHIIQISIVIDKTRHKVFTLQQEMCDINRNKNTGRGALRTINF